MTVSAWARSRGIKVSTAFRAVRDGRVTRRPDGRVDPEAADLQWVERTRPRIDGVSPQRPGTPVRRSARPAALVPVGGNGSHGAAAVPPPLSLLVERTRRERAEADLAELRVAKTTGAMILVDEAASMWESAVAAMRARMLASVGRYAARAVGLRTIREANALLEQVVFGALSAAASVAGEVERGDV